METIVPSKEEEITVAAFERWLTIGRPGTKFTYHRGNLASDREDVTMLPGMGQFAHVFYEPFHTLGKMAWHYYQRGLVELAQKKLPNGRGFEYIAFKRKQRRSK